MFEASTLGRAMPTPAPFVPRPLVAASLPSPAEACNSVQDAYDRGRVDGEAAAMAMAQPEIAALREALAALGDGGDAIEADGTALLLSEIERLVREIVGSATVDGQLLTERARTLVLAAAELDGERVLVAHPDDLALLSGLPPGVRTRGDATLDRGDIRLECGAAWLEDGVGIRLAQLASSLRGTT